MRRFAILLSLLALSAATAFGQVVTGRIAISDDGNIHDLDDITSSALTRAIIDRSGNAANSFTGLLRPLLDYYCESGSQDGEQCYWSH